jgi:hypothetical protein
MKKYLTDKEIAHVWASGSQTEGRTKPSGGSSYGSWNSTTYGGSRQSFMGSSFYSYSTAIGYRFKTKAGKPVFLLDSADYSRATRTHQLSLWTAMRHWDRRKKEWVPDHINFTVDTGGRGLGMFCDAPREVIDWYVNQAHDRIAMAGKQHIRFRDDLYVKADHLISEARRFARLMGLKSGKMPHVSRAERRAAKLAGDKWKAGVEERRDRAREAKRKQRDERIQFEKEESVRRANDLLAGVRHTDYGRNEDYFGYQDCDLDHVPELKDKIQEWRMERDSQNIQAWMSGVDVSPKETWPVMLRRDGDEIETSRGARFSVVDGERAFRFVQLVVKRGKDWRSNGEKFSVGCYTLDSVTAAGDSVAGCHRIRYQEICRFAQQMGWM